MALTEVGTATVSQQESIGSSTVNVSRTVTAGSKGLSIGISYYNGSGTVTISGVTWNTSESATIAITSANAEGDYRSAIATVVNPTAGTFNVTVTFSAEPSGVRITVREWSNLNTSTPSHDAAAANGDSATATVDVSNVVAGEVVIDAVAAGNVLTAGAGQTTDQNGELVVGSGNKYGATGYDATSTGTVTESYSVSGGSLWAICALALKEGSGGGGGGPTVTWVGYIG